MANRPSNRLTYSDAVQSWIMRWRGDYKNRIAAHFDTNPARLYDVWRGKRYPGSRNHALQALRKSDPELASIAATGQLDPPPRKERKASRNEQGSLFD